MNWKKVSIVTTNDGVEAVSNLLIENNAKGTEIINPKDLQNLQTEFPSELLILDDLDTNLSDDVIVNAYFTDDEKLNLNIDNIKHKLLEFRSIPEIDFGKLKLSINDINDRDWKNEWKKYYHVTRITHDITIVPSWEKYSSNKEEKVIRLDPGMSFGTGTHPTTKLMIQALEMIMRGNETVIDVGTGSGVLAILARLLGAKQVYGYDIDQIAINASKDNLKLNPQVDNVLFKKNDLLNDVNVKADIIIGNLLAEIILPLIPQTLNNLSKNGFLLLSGIIKDKFDVVKQCLVGHQFKIVEILNLGEWFGIIAKNNS